MNQKSKEIFFYFKKEICLIQPNNLWQPYFSADDFLGDYLISLGGDGKVQCAPCGKVLSHYTSARRHYINTHLPSESATCHLCSRTYKNSQTMKAHMKRDHGVSQRMINDQRKSLNNSLSNVKIEQFKEQTSPV